MRLNSYCVPYAQFAIIASSVCQQASLGPQFQCGEMLLRRGALRQQRGRKKPRAARLTFVLGRQTAGCNCCIARILQPPTI